MVAGDICSGGSTSHEYITTGLPQLERVTTQIRTGHTAKKKPAVPAF
jgi:hypothetical protein